MPEIFKKIKCGRCGFVFDPEDTEGTMGVEMHGHFGEIYRACSNCLIDLGQTEDAYAKQEMLEKFLVEDDGDDEYDEGLFDGDPDEF